METRPELSPKCHKVNVSCQDRHWAKQGLLGTSTAMQHSRLEWKIQSFSLQTLTAVSSHRCLGLFKAREHRLVSGCIVAITDNKHHSLRLAGKSQALMDGLGHAERIGRHLSSFFFARQGRVLKEFELQAILVDCNWFWLLPTICITGGRKWQEGSNQFGRYEGALLHGINRWCASYFNWQMPLQRYVLRQRIYLKVHWGKTKITSMAESTEGSMLAASAAQQQWWLQTASFGTGCFRVSGYRGFFRSQAMARDSA